MKGKKYTYKVIVEFNPPGFQPITVTVTVSEGRSMFAEFSGNRLRPLLKQAMDAIEVDG